MVHQLSSLFVGRVKAERSLVLSLLHAAVLIEHLLKLRVVGLRPCWACGLLVHVTRASG